MMPHRIDAPLETYCQFLNSIPDAALLVYGSGDIAAANEAAVQLFGGEAGTFWAHNVQQLIPESLRDSHHSKMQRYWGKPVALSMANRDGVDAVTRDGTQVPVAVMLDQMILQDGHYVLAICRDMSREQQQRTDLRDELSWEKELATTDSLTGAANLRHFKTELVYEIERSARHGRIFTIAYLDLDNFKEVNDSLGHAEGDRLLNAIVAVAHNRLRKTDLMARIGGDEFAVLLPETDATTMRSPISDLLNEIKQTMERNEWPVTISCGVVAFRTPPPDADKAISSVDKLMYEVKASGKNGVREAVFERGATESRNQLNETGTLPD